MKNKKALAVALVSLISGTTLVGCGKDKDKSNAYFAFSVGLPTGTKTLVVGKPQTLTVFDNGVNNKDKTYKFESNNPDVASIDENTGVITPRKPGKVGFSAYEVSKPTQIATLGADIDVVNDVPTATGGFNFSSTIDPLNPTDRTLTYDEKAKILGQLEKHAMDSHLTGITLFDNGGLMKYSPRVQLKSRNYITGYGFGLLQDGKIDTSKKLKGITTYEDYYHTSFSQDPLTINQYNATGSQVGDLASYITSTYWSTRRSTEEGKADTDYEWYPVLATDKIKVPTVNGDGSVSYAATETANLQPVPMEAKNEKELYKRWRIYVKAQDHGEATKIVDDSDHNTIRYTTMSENSKAKKFNNRAVNIDDYEFIYKLLLTGKNALKRGTEMAKDTSHGIKGASRYYEDTATMTDVNAIDEKWVEYQGEAPADSNAFQATGKLGLRTGKDQNGNFIDIELINAIDSFTAMYTLSSSLVSPLPKDFFVGENGIANNYKAASEDYGQKSKTDASREIIDNVLCVGPYTLEKWNKNQLILFKLNKKSWFECTDDFYTIAGIYNEQVNIDNDTEKVYKRFTEDEALDVTSIPISKVDYEQGRPDTLVTEGDSTFKLNINSCTQDQWNKIFKDDVNGYKCKPWMSNSHFLDGLFFSIDRYEFAKKRGVNPSCSYFSDSYMANPVKGTSYNKIEVKDENGNLYKPHEEAISYYHNEPGENDNFGYDFDRAVDNFRIAVNQLAESGAVTLGTEKKPEEINIKIWWMNKGSDIKEYGEDIANYMEKAFNHISVCGGKLKLKVLQEEVSKWEDVYNEYMMKGKFDLAFGAISGNSYDPLNFMEVLKSDNSSTFTLNWAEDTNDAETINPIIYKGNKWSFDSLWTVADHGGISQNGKRVDSAKKCIYKNLKSKSGSVSQLFNGFDVDVPVEFTLNGAAAEGVSFKVDRVDVYVAGKGNVTVWENDGSTPAGNQTIHVNVPQGNKDTEGTAAYINEQIRKAQGWLNDDGTPNYDSSASNPSKITRDNPFTSQDYDNYWSLEVYYTMTIGGADGVSSEQYIEVKRA